MYMLIYLCVLNVLILFICICLYFSYMFVSMCADVRAYKGLSGRGVRAVPNCKLIILFYTILCYTASSILSIFI